MPDTPSPKPGFWKRLKQGLSGSAVRLGGGVTALFTKRKLDTLTLEALEELLIGADLGPTLAMNLTEKLRKTRFDKEVSDTEIKEFLAAELTTLLIPVAKPFAFGTGLQVVLVVGVNGNGKTTSIGKLAHFYKAQGRTVAIAAADTFRAAAVEQLATWATRAGVPLYTGQDGTTDPAAVAFQAAQHAVREGIDLLFIDTAGRLHSQENLLAELTKIRRVLTKISPELPQHTVLVLDATTGLTALQQVAVFKKAAHLTGLFITKLDGTARGGVVCALTAAHGLPIHAVGVGEGIEDFQPFSAEAFSKGVVGLD
jgi:fused signal recognition particle receptor